MNKKTKKRIIGLALVFALFAVIASGTLAYFTDETEKATNTFTVGRVQIRLSESLVDENGLAKDTDAKPKDAAYVGYTGNDADGNIFDFDGVLKNANRTEDGNNAKNDKATKVKGYDDKEYGYSLMPGKTVDKDPVVTVLKYSEESYVRAKVTLSHAAEFARIFKEHVDAGDITYTGSTSASDIDKAIEAVKTFFVGYDPTVWKAVGAKVEGTSITVTFNYVGTQFAGSTAGTVKKNDKGNTNLEPIITAIKLPEWVTSEDAARFETKTGTKVTEVGFDVDVIGEAFQAAGFADADEAWAAFDGPATEPQQ